MRYVLRASIKPFPTPLCNNKVTKTKNLIIFRVQEFFSSDTDAAAGAAATAAAPAAATAAATVATTVKTVVKIKAAAEAAAVAAAVAAAPAAASVSEEKNSWTLNIIKLLVFVTLIFHRGLEFFWVLIFRHFQKFSSGQFFFLTLVLL